MYWLGLNKGCQVKFCNKFVLTKAAETGAHYRLQMKQIYTVLYALAYLREWLETKLTLNPNKTKNMDIAV